MTTPAQIAKDVRHDTLIANLHNALTDYGLGNLSAEETVYEISLAYDIAIGRM